MSDRPIGLGKVAENGTLNENGAFYSVQDINVLLENGGGGGGDLPTPTVADAGSVVVVDEEGKYALGEGGALLVTITYEDSIGVLDKNYREIKEALISGKSVVFMRTIIGDDVTILYMMQNLHMVENEQGYSVVLYGIDTEDNNALFTWGFFSETDSGTLTYE